MADTTLRLLLLGEDRSASKALKGVGDAADASGKKVTTAGKSMGGALPVAVFAAAAAGAVAFGKSSIEASQGAARSQRELEDAYGRFPALASVSIDRMRELNQAIQDKTGADADDIASSQAVLARYKLTGDQIADMTPLLVDYAARTGKDLPAAGSTLGKALAGNARAMKELGISFKDTGDPAKNFDQVMKGLKEKVGGFAESEASTLDGKMAILAAKFGDLQESVGDQLVPALTSLADVAADVVDWIGQNSDVLGPLAVVVGVAATAYVALTAAGAAYTAFQAASAAATGGLTVAQWALNAALSANPIGLVVIAIAALVAGLVIAYKRSDTFRSIVDGAFKAVGAAGKWLWNSALAPALRAIVNGFAWVTEGIAGMVDALGNVPGFGWAKTAAKAMRATAADARRLAGDIRDIPDADPKIKARDEATAKIRQIDRQIKSLKGKIVEAKAKGDTREVDRLKARIAALQGKRVPLTVHVARTGIRSISVSAPSGSVRWSLKAVARGGIIRAMAAGGIDGAHIYSRSDGVMFNEPETMGEAYIPLANDWRRPRAVAVWRETGKLIGAMAAGGISGAAASGGGGDTITINATVARGVDPLAFAREVEQSLVTLRQRKGGQPLAFQK